jgi:hypothetical protein
MKPMRATSQFVSPLYQHNILKVIGKYLRFFCVPTPAEYFLQSIRMSIRPYELLHVFNNSRTAEQIFANVDFGEICKKKISNHLNFFFNRAILTTTSHEVLRAFARTSGE